jgi:hypothetical protein
LAEGSVPLCAVSRGAQARAETRPGARRRGGRSGTASRRRLTVAARADMMSATSTAPWQTHGQKHSSGRHKCGSAGLYYTRCFPFTAHSSHQIGCVTKTAPIPIPTWTRRMKPAFIKPASRAPRPHRVPDGQVTAGIRCPKRGHPDAPLARQSHAHSYPQPLCLTQLWGSTVSLQREHLRGTVRAECHETPPRPACHRSNPQHGPVSCALTASRNRHGTCTYTGNGVAQWLGPLPLGNTISFVGRGVHGTPPHA